MLYDLEALGDKQREEISGRNGSTAAQGEST
jgi:hypothetical protein